jgi:hypothetical protein
MTIQCSILSTIGHDTNYLKPEHVRHFDGLEQDRLHELNSSSFPHRLGISTLAILITTNIVVLPAITFIVFLWHSNTENRLWHAIVTGQWLASAITMSGFALQSAVDVQIGIATAMLAAVVLERGNALLKYDPHLSNARASRPRLRSLLFPVFRSTILKSNAVQIIVTISLLLLRCTTVSLQFLSTFLLSDLRLGNVPGFVDESVVSYDYAYPLGDIMYQDAMAGLTSIVRKQFTQFKVEGTAGVAILLPTQRLLNILSPPQTWKA